MGRRQSHTESHAVSRPYGMAITRQRTESGAEWLNGNVVTPYGIVAAYSQSDHSRYDFVHGGRHYIRTDGVGRTELGLVRMAAKWARQIAEEGR